MNKILENLHENFINLLVQLYWGVSDLHRPPYGRPLKQLWLRHYWM